MSNLFNWSDATWQMLDQAGILAGNIIMGITVVGGIIGYLSRERLRRWFTRNRFPLVGGRIEAREWDAVVFTVSRKDVPLWVIDQLKPKCIGLVASEQSMPAAHELFQAAVRQGLSSLAPQRIDDPDDPSDAVEKTRWLLQNLHDRGYSACAVDVTGGKTPMSLGAFMAAEEMGADTLYVTVHYDENLRRANMRSAALRRISTPK